MDDDRYVETALELGVVTKAQIAEAEQQRRQLADRGLERSVWFLLQDLGLITEDQARRVRKGMSSSVVRALEVGGFVLEGRLGSGGMGDVFRGRNVRGEVAAVKLLASKFAKVEEYRRRFEREARAAQRLDHPHICRCLGHGEAAGTRYLIMDIVEGPSLKGRLTEKGPLNEPEILTLLEQMALALGHAWKHGVLHRDVKPANILLGPARPGTDEPFCARLIDFGLAKVWREDGDHSAEDSHGGLTAAGLALGTPHYMSPEQASGVADLDQRCDIYGLGASAYHAMLGHTLYSGKSSAVIMYKQVTESLDLTELRRQGVREHLVALLERMLAKDRLKRIATWEEVLKEVRRLRASLAPGGPPPAESTTGHRRWWWLGGAGVAATLAVAIGIGLTRPGGTATTSIVTPERFAVALAAHPTALRLAPGAYDPLHLGASQQGLHLLGMGADVGFGTGARQDQEPALALDAGATRIVVQHVTLSGPLALTLGAGTELVLEDAVIAGRAEIAGGTLTLIRCTVQDRLLVHRGGLAELTDSTCAGLTAEDATVHARNCRFSATLQARAGELHLAGCTLQVTAAPGEPALLLDRTQTTHLEGTSIAGADVAIQSLGANLSLLKDCILTARLRGISWLGPADPSWQWSGSTVDAPTPVNGLPASFSSRLTGHAH